MLMDATEKKISTFNLNLNWWDSWARSVAVISSCDCEKEVGTNIISFNPRPRADAAYRHSEGKDDRPLPRSGTEFMVFEKESASDAPLSMEIAYLKIQAGRM